MGYLEWFFIPLMVMSFWWIYTEGKKIVPPEGEHGQAALQAALVVVVIELVAYLFLKLVWWVAVS